jgi:hypothetical protein
MVERHRRVAFEDKDGVLIEKVQIERKLKHPDRGSKFSLCHGHGRSGRSSLIYGNCKSPSKPVIGASVFRV